MEIMDDDESVVVGQTGAQLVEAQLVPISAITDCLSRAFLGDGQKRLCKFGLTLAGQVNA